MKSLHELIEGSGQARIQVPYFEQNPFDLLVFDHCNHFSPGSLRNLIEMAGFEVELLTTEWCSREISAVAKPTVEFYECLHWPRHKIQNHLRKSVNWLLDVQNEVQSFEKCQQFGVFGASLAGLWIAESNSHVKFIVDEDSARAGKEFVARPVLLPSEVPIDSKVYVPLAR